MLSTAGCWAAYCEVLAREYRDSSYRLVNRLTVDAYAVQHPGEDMPQARNSVGVHLSRLALIFERGFPIEQANEAMVAITARDRDYPWLTPPRLTPARLTPARLTPPQSRGQMTLRDVMNATNPHEHHSAVERWAHSAWMAWSEHHSTVLSWVREIDA
jgi:hypothetical protein